MNRDIEEDEDVVVEHPQRRARPAGPSPNEAIDETDVDREERDLVQRLVDGPTLARDPEPELKNIVADTIPDENLTLVSGNGGTGKTTLIAMLAAAMQTDGEWLGMKVTQGGAMFVTSEDGRRDLNRILRAILNEQGKSLAHCPKLHILSLADRDACLAQAQSRLAPLVPTPLWMALERLIARRKPRLLILDSRADMFGGEEGFRRHVRGFIVLLKQLAIKYGLAVVLIEHPSLTGMNTGTGLSGSTDWHNGPRARLFLEKKAADKDLHTLTVTKMQYSDSEGTVFHLRRRPGFFVYQGKEGGSGPYDRAAAAAKAERVFLALLQIYHDQGRTASPNPSASYAPTVFADSDDADGVTRTALKRAMDKLLKADRIHVETAGPPSKRRKTLAPGPDPAKTATQPEGQRDA
jgi:RecA-family ATPase